MKYGVEEFNPNTKQWALRPEDVSGRMLMVDKATTIAYQRQIMSLAGIPSLEKLYYDYYQRKQGNPNARILEPNSDEYNRFLTVWTTRVNKAWSGGNRAINIKNNVWLSGMSYLLGYVNNAFLEMLNVFRRTPAGKVERLASRLNQLTIIFAVSAILGLIQKELRDRYKKYLRNEIGKLPSPSSPTFWSTPKTAAQNVLESSLMTIPWIGPIGLNLIGEIQGRRGFEPAEGVFVFSFFTDLIRAMRALNTLPTEDYTYLARIMGERYIPLLKEYAVMSSINHGAIRPSEWVSGSNSAYQVLKGFGLIEERAPSPARFTANITPTSAIKDKLMVALINNNIREANLQMERLKNMYYDNAIKNGDDPETAYKNSLTRLKTEYKMMHPLAMATQRRNITMSQYNRMIENMSDSQIGSYTNAVRAWQRGAALIDGLDSDYIPVEKEETINQSGKSASSSSSKLFSGEIPKTLTGIRTTTEEANVQSVEPEQQQQPTVATARKDNTATEQKTTASNVANTGVSTQDKTEYISQGQPAVVNANQPSYSASTTTPQSQSVPVSNVTPDQSGFNIRSLEGGTPPNVSTSAIPSDSGRLPLSSPKSNVRMPQLVTGGAPNVPVIKTGNARQANIPNVSVSAPKLYGKGLLSNRKAVRKPKLKSTRVYKVRLLSAKTKRKIKA